MLLVSPRYFLRRKFQVVLREMIQFQAESNLQAWNCSEEWEKLLISKDKIPLNFIPLNRVRKVGFIWYVSAIALKGSQLLNQPSLDIAQEIAGKLGSMLNASQQLELWVEQPGWIHCRFQPGGVANWLQAIAAGLSDEDYNLFKESVENIPAYNSDFLRENTSVPFLILHSHARCCSLLAMAHREGLLTLSTGDRPTASPQLLPPDPLPWLKSSGVLQFTQPEEQALMDQWLTTVDDLVNDLADPQAIASCEAIIKLAIALSDRFQQFYAATRIWGDISATDPELALARLGLVLGTQRLLRVLLEDGLGIPAPEAL